MVFYGKNLGVRVAKPYSNVSSRVDTEKEKVDEMSAKPLTNDEEEQASSQEISKKQHISKNIYEDGKKSTLAMMNPPRATEIAEQEVSRAWENKTTWESHLSSKRRKSDSKDGEPISPYRNYVGLKFAAAHAPAAQKKRKLKINSYKAGTISKSSKGKFSSQSSQLPSSDRKAVENKVAKGFASDFEFNKGPRIDGGSVGDSGIENMNRIFLAK
ncbi:hypothetical protein Ancab_016756 [Ancistrocladus abbreviatus]